MFSSVDFRCERINNCSLLAIATIRHQDSVEAGDHLQASVERRYRGNFAQRQQGELATDHGDSEQYTGAGL